MYMYMYRPVLRLSVGVASVKHFVLVLIDSLVTTFDSSFATFPHKLSNIYNKKGVLPP